MAVDDSIHLKTCSQCRQAKARTEFSIHRQKKDGLSSWCKPCAVAKVRTYTDSPESRAKKKAYDAARTAQMKDAISNQGRARYLANRERALHNAERWKNENPEKRRAIAQSYKHRRRTVEKAGISGAEFRAWKEATPKVCYWCEVDCTKEPIVDHYQPLAKGGKHEIANLVMSCRPCNAKKAARDPLEFAASIGRAVQEMLS